MLSQANALNRVPQIIFLYWIIKIAATTLGETGADMFSMTIDIGYTETIYIFTAVFLIFLISKLLFKRYEPILYWLVFTSSAILGTAISDFIDRTLGLGYMTGSAILLSLLIFSLIIWYVAEKTIDVEMITTTRAEIFYWWSFLIANTLGTAIGDYLADELQIGFMISAISIAVVLAIVALLHYTTTISGVILFWIAFVLTRPFGATFGDFLTKTQEAGGIDLGTIDSSIVFLVILLIGLIFEKNRVKNLAKNAVV